MQPEINYSVPIVKKEIPQWYDSNLNGDFSLKVPANATLIVFIHRYEDTKIAIKGKTKST